MDTDLVQILGSGRDYAFSAPMVRAVELGPYPMAVRVDVKAYANHRGGDDSVADLLLFYDGAKVGEAHDQHFSSASLAVDFSVILGPGNVANFRLQSTNDHGANELNYGFNFVLRRP